MCRQLIIPVLLLLSACAQPERKHFDLPVPSNAPAQTLDTASKETSTPVVEETKKYANQRFREVEVSQISGSAFLITGKAQVFEANFGWAVEDGHNEIATGHTMTDAGAPEWGKFQFKIDAPKQRPNSTRTLLLFENSAKDGQRVFELAIPLD